MKPSISFALLLSLFLLGSCAKLALKSDQLAIRKIQKADSKQVVTVSELPETMAAAFTTAENVTIYFVSNEGYEVMTCNNTNDPEDCCYSYYDTDGNSLDCSALMEEEEEEEDDCHDDDWNDWDDWEYDMCVGLVYPLTVLLPDSTNITASTEEDLDTQLEAWLDANPNEDDDLFTFQFPIQVIVGDDTNNPVTVQTMIEFERLLEACEEDYDDEEEYYYYCGCR